MDLTCDEIVMEKMDLNSVAPDLTMMTDPRIIPNMLYLERETTVQFDYFTHVQAQIEPYMRKVVAEWMMEVR